MLDYKFYRIVSNYHNIVVNNKSNNVRSSLINNLLTKYKIKENNMLANNIMIYMYSHLMYFGCI
jgi:hypothetical protein